jgi:actin-related protein
VSSLVYDLGTFACRVGYSGEDSPKVVIQPSIGINKNGDYSSYYFSEVGLRYYKEGTKVHNVVNSNGASKNIIKIILSRKLGFI